MRRFIILSAIGLGLCFGGSTMAQAAVMKQVTKKVVVEKQIVTERVGPTHVAHWTNRHFAELHRFRR